MKTNFRKWDERKQNRMYVVGFCLLIGLISFLAFYKLDAKYVDPWDEARHGVNAYEMLKEGKLIQSTYLYETDYYNLKPPLSMWCIMLSFCIFGTNVFALRFYSAFCYVLLCVFVGRFVRRHYGRVEALFTLGFLAANTTPFVAHMVRAGDADSLYVLLFTLAMLFMLQIKDRTENIYACGLFFALAFLTKSFHAGVIVLIGGLFLLLTGEWKKLSLKNWVLFTGSFAVPLGVWALCRFATDGVSFFRQMLYTDVLGRSGEGFGSVEGSFTYYMEYYLGVAGSNFPNMIGKRTVYALALLICSFGVGYYSRLFTKQHYRRIIGYLLWFFIPLLAFSAVRTKLLWYLYPIFIPLFMAAGIFTGRLLKEKQIVSGIRMVLAAGIVCGIAYFSRDVYVQITDKIQNQQSAKEFQVLVQETGQKAHSGFVAETGWGNAEGAENTVRAYVLYDKDNMFWNQQDVFVAEAYGDLYCVNLQCSETTFLEGIINDQETNGDTAYICYIYREGYEKAVKEFHEAGYNAQQIGESENYVAVFVQ